MTQPPEPPYADEPYAGPAPYDEPAPKPPVAEAEWQRMDVRYLVVGPFAAARQFVIPAGAAAIGLGSTGSPWALLALPAFVVLSLLFGMVPWLTTYFRVTDTAFEVRRGLLNKTRLTAPLDRVRSVDLEASLVSRVLGLTKVAVGTGVDDTRIELDGIAKADGEGLRRFLLTRSRAAAAPSPAPATDATGTPPAEGGPPPVPAPAVEVEPVELARIDWSWLRFAPLSLARLAVLAGALTFLSQFVNDIPVLETEAARSAYDYVAAQALSLVLVVGAVVALVAWVVVAVAAFVVQWWNLRLVRDGDNLRLTAGLITTRSTSVDEKRVRGVKLTEPLLMRPAGGAELATLATGVGEGGTTTVLPPCPRTVAVRVGEDILGRPTDEPLTVDLHAHGWLARRRLHVQEQVGVLVVAGVIALVVALVPWDLPWWIPLAFLVVFVPLGVVVCEAQYRNLGHRLTAEHLVVVGPSVVRRREVIESDGIIGWVVQQSFFQRRLGLATLVATTAAGGEKVVAVDLALPVAVGLAHAATPGVLDEFLAA
ncbi:PH domain-containing protein [uncultured Nocardioides sp.]|uniref:PH domain-containing protein n=1 Tax=uncultured Nocardioides sp. TaxID=198441 RepID=UPI0026222795|nr:PH domain-containing protein [uncultured Nocardioides sp.]